MEIVIPEEIKNIKYSGLSPKQNKENAIQRICLMQELLADSLREGMPEFEYRNWQLLTVMLKDRGAADRYTRVRAWSYSYSTLAPEAEGKFLTREMVSKPRRALGYTVDCEEPFGCIIHTDDIQTNKWQRARLEDFHLMELAGIVGLLNQLAKGEKPPVWQLPVIS